MKRTVICSSTLGILIRLLINPTSVFSHLLNGVNASHHQAPSTHSLSMVVTATIAENNLTGKWPDLSICWNTNAYIVGVAYLKQAYKIALWYAPICGTNWADFFVLRGGIQKITSYVATSGYQQAESGDTIVGTREWSAMAYTPIAPAKACGGIYPFDDYADDWVCYTQQNF